MIKYQCLLVHFLLVNPALNPMVTWIDPLVLKHGKLILSSWQPPKRCRQVKHESLFKIPYITKFHDFFGWFGIYHPPLVVDSIMKNLHFPWKIWKFTELHGSVFTSSPTQEGCGPYRHADAGLPSKSPRGAHDERVVGRHPNG